MSSSESNDKEWEFLKELQNARTELHSKFVNDANPSQILILKTHLVVDDLLDAIVFAYCAKPEHLDKARLRFGQKVSLARALGNGPDFPEGLWSSILKLDQLRNQLAHSTDAEKLQRKVDAFVSVAETRFSKNLLARVKEDKIDKLEVALGFIQGQLEMLAFWHEGIAFLMRKRLFDDKMD